MEDMYAKVTEPEGQFGVKTKLRAWGGGFLKEMARGFPQLFACINGDVVGGDGGGGDDGGGCVGSGDGDGGGGDDGGGCVGGGDGGGGGGFGDGDEIWLVEKWGQQIFVNLV